MGLIYFLNLLEFNTVFCVQCIPRALSLFKFEIPSIIYFFN